MSIFKIKLMSDY